MAAPAEPSSESASSAQDCDPSWRNIQRVILALLALLLVSLGYRQVFRWPEYVARERRQSLRRIMLPAPRGMIYDREHRVLASNRTCITAVLNLGELREEFHREKKILLHNERAGDSRSGRDDRMTARVRLAVVQRHLNRVNALIGRHENLDPMQLEYAFARDRLTPFLLIDELTAAESEKLTGALIASDKVRLQRTTQRWYPNGRTAAHALGRVRRETIRTAVGPDFATMNFIGTVGDSGIEKQYDERLQGRPGESVIQIDAFGFPVNIPLESRSPISGEDLVLSLDLDVQLAAERAMAATPGVPRGAAVAISVATGEILALASKPDFDLNTVSPALATETKQRIDAEGAWLNRVTQGLYPPGSTFKIFTVSAGLRRGTLHSGEELICNGFLDVRGHRFICHNASGHGRLSLREALAHSCNVFAYQTGLTAGPDALATEARRFHFDEPTGVDLPFESRAMLVPDVAWKLIASHGNWTEIDTANLSIGQGFLRCTPLQVGCAVASLARHETLTVPTLLLQPGRRPTGDHAPEPLGLKDEHDAELIEGLQAVIRTGIGQDAQLPGVTLAGKSGTAQVARKEGMMNVAWFVAFAPVERPEIAIAVAMEGDQPDEEFAGARHAAPIVREIAGAYFDKRARP